MTNKLLFIIPSFRRGGVERVTLNIINSLDFELYEVTLMICTGNDNFMKQLLHSDVNVIELGKDNVRSSLSYIFKYLIKYKPNLVFTSFNHLSLAVLFFKNITRGQYKTIVRANTLPSNRLKSNFRGQVYSIFYRNYIKKADQIISQSDEMREDILKYYEVNPEQVITIRNIVDTDMILSLSKIKQNEFMIDDKIFNLVAIGSLGYVKGFDLLIEAVNNLIKNGQTQYRLYIIGDNREKGEDYMSTLKNMIKSYNLEKYVYLLGFKKNPYAYLAEADAFVLSSRKEGFPNVVLEALVLGIPCVVTDCVDFRGIIKDGVNGVVVKKESVEELERGIECMTKIQTDSSFFIENFDYNNWFGKLI